ncbi:MAG: hypothetical protein AAF740_03275, partial [Bacteroidota bacterium]
MGSLKFNWSFLLANLMAFLITAADNLIEFKEEYLEEASDDLLKKIKQVVLIFFDEDPNDRIQLYELWQKDKELITKRFYNFISHAI